MGSSSMKIHHPFPRGINWDHHHQPHEPSSLGCKRLRPLVPKLVSTNESFDLKSFIRSPEKLIVSSSHHDKNKDSSSHQVVETNQGGTRWNPTQDQIEILEMLYRGGMRTPNAQQIEKITDQLSKYGKIEGKNVFYWFQNHKARERQKLKRTILAGMSYRTPSPATAPDMTSITLTLDTARVGIEREERSPYKKKCRNWACEISAENNKKSNYIDEGDRTLELFPLHPERR